MLKAPMSFTSIKSIEIETCRLPEQNNWFSWAGWEALLHHTNIGSIESCRGTRKGQPIFSTARTIEDAVDTAACGEELHQVTCIYISRSKLGSTGRLLLSLKDR